MAAKNIKIFIASAGEVWEERQKAVLIISRLNNAHKHLWLKPIWWESDAQRGNQPEHGSVQNGINPMLKKSDVVLFIFYSHLGQYTFEEFELATKQNKKLFMYFKNGFSANNKTENVTYGALLDFKESVRKTVLYEHYNNTDHFDGLFYQHLNQYLSDKYPPDDGGIKIPINPAPLPTDVLILIKLLNEKEERIKHLEALLSTNVDSDEVQKLTAEIASIVLQLSQREELWKQQADDREMLEQQLGGQLENDSLKAQVLEAVKKGVYIEAEILLRESAKSNIVTSANTLYELAKVKKLQFQYWEALEYCELAAKIEPNNNLYLHEVGVIAWQLEYIDKALQYYEKSLPLAITKYGKEAPEIAARYNNIALAHYSKGDYDRAIDYYQQALAIDKAIYGESHPEIVIDYNNLGVAYKGKGHYDRAIGYYEQALAINKEFYDVNHPVIASSCNNLGGAYKGKGYYDHAIDYYRQALTIDRAFYGESHPKVAIDYNNLGLAHKGKRDYDRAIDYFEQALTIDREFYGEAHPDIGTLYSNLGSAYNSRNEYHRAIGYYERALAIDSAFYGEAHPEIAIDYNNLGLVYGNRNEYDLAIAYYEQALSILQTFFTPAHLHVAIVRKNLQFAKQAQANKAQSYLYKSK